MTRARWILIWLLGMPLAAEARDIPMDIRWSGTAPTEVLLVVPGGVDQLSQDSQSPTYRGEISVPSGKPERRTIIVRYGSFSHPVDFRVHGGLSRVTFFVAHQRQGSCTRTRVRYAAIESDNLADAVSRSVAAGELISIPEPNACDGDLRFRAVRARFLQNAKMAELSNGFFLINRDVERQYRQEARARGLNVDEEVAAFIDQDEKYEARQLLVFRYAAHVTGNYDLALEVNDLIGERIASDAEAAVLYQAQGATESNLAAYARAFEVQAMAKPIEDDEQEPE